MQNEVPSGCKTKLPLFASKEKHVGKNTIYSYKDFDRSKKLSQFTFNGQNFFFWLTPCAVKQTFQLTRCGHTQRASSKVKKSKMQQYALMVCEHLFR